MNIIKNAGFKFKFVAMATAIVFTQSNADAANFSIGPAVAFTIQNPQFSENGGTQSVDGKTGIGGGIISEISINESFGLEIDLLYLNHKFSRKTSAIFGSEVTSTFSSGYINVPAILRYRPVPFLNLGAGVYYSRILSDWKVSAEGYGTQNYNYSKSNFGALIAAGLIIPMGTVSIVGDLRYLRSLSDSARESNEMLKFADLQIILGARFTL